MRSISGLGTGNKQILKKIPLILRELRCQSVFPGIAGELCYVVDNRVLENAGKVGISLEEPGSLDKLIGNSTRIYKLFGDLYNIPLFSYGDIV